MSSGTKNLLLVALFAILSGLSGCAVERVNIEQEFDPSGIIRSQLPIDAKLQVYVASDYNGKVVKYRNVRNRVQMADGVSLERALLDVGRKFFREVTVFDPTASTDFLLVAGAITYASAEGQTTFLSAELYDASGRLVNRLGVRGSESSNLATLDAGIFNAHAYAAQHYYNRLFVFYERNLRESLGKGPAKRVDTAELVKSKGLRVNMGGTGFIINADGDIVTNAHVVQGCMKIDASYAGKPLDLSVRALDSDADLAVLSSELREESFARFAPASGSAKLGEEVIAIGYPLMGVLASQPSLSVGHISSLAGIKDDDKVFQISAPVQPGNSGGPLLSSTGAVVGVVQSKLNALMIAELTGDIPQNINFAVKSDVARGFLDGNDIHYTTEPSAHKLTTTAVAEKASGFVVNLSCHSITHEQIEGNITRFY